MNFPLGLQACATTLASHALLKEPAHSTHPQVAQASVGLPGDADLSQASRFYQKLLDEVEMTQEIQFLNRNSVGSFGLSDIQKCQVIFPCREVKKMLAFTLLGSFRL